MLLAVHMHRVVPPVKTLKSGVVIPTTNFTWFSIFPFLVSTWETLIVLRTYSILVIHVPCPTGFVAFSSGVEVAVFSSLIVISSSPAPIREWHVMILLWYLFFIIPHQNPFAHWQIDEKWDMVSYLEWQSWRFCTLT